MKVAHLTSAHERYDTRIFLKECRSLAAAGHDVTLFVADGKGDERHNGVSIVDVGKSAGRLRRMLSTVHCIYNRALAVEADVYHLHDPELLRIALKLKKQRRGKAAVVYDAHEDLPRQILSKHWIPALLRYPVSWLAERFENYVATRLSGILAATPHIAKRFAKINLNTVDVNNYPMPGELTSVQSSVKKKRQICYVGGIAKIRGIEPLVRSLPLVPDVSLVLCGTFSQADVEQKAKSLPGWQQVDFRGQVDRQGVRQVLSESMAGVVTFLPLPNHMDAQPNKMFEYMSAELPVVASDFPLWRKIIDGAGAGICVDPESPQAIAEAVRKLVDDKSLTECMGENGRKAVMKQYNWPHEAAKLVTFYEGLK